MIGIIGVVCKKFSLLVSKTLLNMFINRILVLDIGTCFLFYEHQGCVLVNFGMLICAGIFEDRKGKEERNVLPNEEVCY